MWRIPAELVTIVSSYDRRGKNYFHLMSWPPVVFRLCFFLAPMQHFATLSSASALYGRDRFVPRREADMKVSYACVNAIGCNDQCAVGALAERNDDLLDVTAVTHDRSVRLDRQCGGGTFEFTEIEFRPNMPVSGLTMIAISVTAGANSFSADSRP